jgi:Ser/Thr protein kinase RdoA (MazF antagonist)
VTDDPNGLAAWVRTTFGWHGDVRVGAGPRGAVGQLWRVEAGTGCYALKEIFDEPPTEHWIAAELAFSRVAVGAGARVPASHPDRDGRYLIPTPHGTWVRCYDWVDLQPLRPDAPGTPERLGTLLARLHRLAPQAPVEFDGEPPDSWYDAIPDHTEWSGVLTGNGPRWAAGLEAQLPLLPELCAAVAPSDPATLVVCHRDLHPENVVVDPAGHLTVVDFDDAGPAAAERELARAAFDWFCDRSGTDLDAIRAMLTAYVAAGGPGRVTEPVDFSMLLAARLNFVLSQARLAMDPQVDARHRATAEREIEMMLSLWPTRTQLDQVLAICRSVFS